MRLRDSDTGRFVSFDDYIAREGEGVTIEGVDDTGKDEFEPTDYDDIDEMGESMDFDDMDMYP